MPASSCSVRLVVGKVALSCVCLAAAASPAGTHPLAIHHPDHFEFEATLHTPLHADANGQFPLLMQFDYNGAGRDTMGAWQVDVLDAHKQVVRRWIGETSLASQHGRYALSWNGRDDRNQTLSPGFYSVRMSAVPAILSAGAIGKPLFERVHRSFGLFRDEMVVQSQDVMLGDLHAPAMHPFQALPTSAQLRARNKGVAGTQSVVATGSLPYTIYFGNLHSQTNHSDGGGALASCTGAQNPQSGAFGPTDAYTMMQNQAGGDFLMASEHNHMFDGSDGTNASANPAAAKALFQSGLAAAANYNAAHPGFLALYGNEWGVISNGGHMNVFGLDGLPEWESNSSGQLIGDYYTPKSDYAAMYALMKQHGWIGMFNHPASSGQFQINGTALAYDANGDAVMVLAEVLNSSAFSTNTTQTETSRSTYQSAFDALLERGYHVAPATDQDNHCANWGLSYRNRTGVLLPNGATLNTANFYEALRARRVFAAEDKSGQLILTANGAVMGQSISNSGALTLVANYASSSGQTAARVQFFEGVPARNGSVTQLFEGSGSVTVTPTSGKHFYYALITQANGDRLWSAPIWVDQGTGGGGGDTTAPTVSAGEAGSSGTIALSASASDNVGVTRVEFYVDGVLKGTDSSNPYSVTLDSTTLADGSHALTAKAFDAAGNVGTSSTVAFTVSNATSTQFNEVESNGSVSAANTVAHSYKTVVGTLGNSTDKDYFKIALAAGETLKIDMTGPAGNDYDLYMVNGSDATLKSSTGSTATESLTYTNGSAAQTVYAKVISYSGSSTTLTYTLTLTYTGGGSGGGGGSSELIGNGGFESGNTVWTATSGVIDNSSGAASHAGSWKAWLDGYGSAHTDTLRQTVTIPASAASATLSFWLKVTSSETTTTTANDTLKVQVRNASGGVLSTLHTYSNLDKGSSYVQRSFDLSAWKGQTVQIYFEGVEGSSTATSFLIDDVSVKTQ